MPAEGRGLGSRQALEVAKHGRLGQPYRTPLMCESCGRPPPAGVALSRGAQRPGLAEIAYLLGYSEPSAFNHAFRR